MECSVELQSAVHALLLGSSEVSNVVSNRIYDRVPKSVEFPYITYGDVSQTPFDSKCVYAGIYEFEIGVWSRIVGGIEAKNIGGIVKRLLHDRELILAQNASGPVVFRSARMLGDPDDSDNLTKHVNLTFRCIIQEK